GGKRFRGVLQTTAKTRVVVALFSFFRLRPKTNIGTKNKLRKAFAFPLTPLRKVLRTADNPQLTIHYRFLASTHKCNPKPNFPKAFSRKDFSPILLNAPFTHL